MKKWTFLIYFSGDNNLSVDMAYTIDQIRRTSSLNPNINVLIYFDGYSPEIPTLYADFSGAYADHRFERSHKIKNKLFEVENERNENSASMENLLNFVHWAVNQVEFDDNGTTGTGRKAENYGLIFSGHSMGFQSIGLFQDSKANYNMTMPKLRWSLDRLRADQTTLDEWAIDDEAKHIESQKEKAAKEKCDVSEVKLGWTDEERKRRTTVVVGKNLALLGFDSCMMGMLEVASQFAGMAETMVASEGSIPNAGWSYAQMLFDAAAQNNSMSAADLAISFVDAYIKQQNQHAIGGVAVDIAAWNLTKDKMDAVNDAFEEFAGALIDCLSQSDANYGQAKRALLSARCHCQSYTMEQNVDLVDFCELLTSEIAAIRDEIGEDKIEKLLTVSDKATNVIAAVRECILLSGFSGGRNQYSNGVSIYFPWTKESYCASLDDYLRLEFVDRSEKGVRIYSNWKTFLEAYLGKVTHRSPRAIGETANSTVFESYYYEQNEAQSPAPDCIATGNAAHEQKTPPYGSPRDRRPPFGSPNDRRPPYGSVGDRGVDDFVRGMSGAMSLFFDQYARIKNVATPWNLAGFSSTNVRFVTARSQQTTVTNTAQSRIIPVVFVPHGNRIFKKLDDYLRRFPLHERERLFGILKDISDLGNVDALDEFTKNLDFIRANESVSLIDAVRLSTNKISDAKIRAEFNTKMKF